MSVDVSAPVSDEESLNSSSTEESESESDAESEVESEAESSSDVSYSDDELDETAITELLASIGLLPEEDKPLVTEELIRFVCETKCRGALEGITASLKEGSYTRELWHDKKGDTLHLLR